MERALGKTNLQALRPNCKCRKRLRGRARRSHRAGAAAPASASGLGLGHGLAFRRGGRTTAAPLGGVVVHIPAAALEVETGSGQGPLEPAGAFRALRQRVGVKTLDLLKTMATGSAAVRIKGQG